MGLREALEKATALISPQLRQDTKRLVEQIRSHDEQGNYALWMDALFKMGAVAEEWGRDAELPPDFWRFLEFAAQKMQFPQFVPQARGKAEGLPRRTLCDYLAAIVVIHRELGTHWAGCFPGQPKLLDDFVRQLAAVDADYPALFQSEIRAAIAHRFEADGWRADPCPERFFSVRRDLHDLFYPLFQFICAAGFPESLADECWCVVGFNAFEVRVGGGLMPLTEAKPWWA